MNLRHTIAVILSVVAIAGCTANHTVFDKRNSDYTIVVAADASECVRYAAEELQHWTEEVSGVSIPIAETGKKGRRLVVGNDGKEHDGVNDSFSYESRGGDVFFCGDTDRGTLYSVYSFLETEFGCRWYNSRVSLIPKCDSWGFTKLEHSEAPAIRMRNDFYWDVNVHPEFAARLRSNSTHSSNWPAKFGGSETYWSCHTLPDSYIRATVSRIILNITECWTAREIHRLSLACQILMCSGSRSERPAR